MNAHLPITFTFGGKPSLENIKLRKLGTNMLSRWQKNIYYTCRTWPWSNEHMRESRICLGVYRYFILCNEEMGQKQENQEYLYSWGKLGWKMVKVHLPSFLGHRLNTSCPQDPSFRMMWLSRFSLVCVQTGLSQNSLPPHALRRSWLIWISCVANQWLFGSYIIIFWILCLTWSSFLVLCSCLNHLRTVAPSQDAILSYSWWKSIYGGGWISSMNFKAIGNLAVCFFI